MPMRIQPISKRRVTKEYRPNSTKRGYGGKWQSHRKSFLKSNPLCVKCNKVGQVTAATVVDHIKPHRGNNELFWNVKNWQALCKPCHDKKTGSGQ